MGLVYTGIEGLTVSLGTGNDNSTVAVDADYTTMKASYVYGSITASVSASEYDHTTAANDQEVKSFGLSYTVTDDISVSLIDFHHILANLFFLIWANAYIH